MAALIVTAKKTEVKTVDGNEYNFTRNNIEYALFIKNDCIDIWRKNNLRGTISNDCFWGGINNQGKPMAKFIKAALKLIEA